MSAAATVTVIIPTYNRAQYLVASLESVLSQTHRPAQVIVVNDGSTDQTEEVLAPYRERIIYLATENRGKPSAINAALPLVEGKYLWVFDDDDIACEDTLARHVNFLESRPDVGFSFGGTYWFEHDRNGEPLEITGENPVRPFDDDEYFMELLLSPYAASPAVVVRAAIQREAGDYNPECLRCEDTEMAIRWGRLAPAARLAETRPTYYRRLHMGKRGPRGREIDYRRNTAVNREYERTILKDLAGQLPLTLYLPYSQRDLDLGPNARARATARLWTVHMQKGMWADAVKDLHHLAQLPPLEESLKPVDDLYFRRPMGDINTVYELQQNPEAIVKLRDVLKAPRMKRLELGLAKGLYYQAHYRWSERAWRTAFVCTSLAWQLFGIRGFLRMMR